MTVLLCLPLGDRGIIEGVRELQFLSFRGLPRNLARFSPRRVACGDLATLGMTIGCAAGFSFPNSRTPSDNLEMLEMAISMRKQGPQAFALAGFPRVDVADLVPDDCN